MKSFIGVLATLLLPILPIHAEDVVFKKTNIILPEAVKDLEKKKGEEAPIKIVMNDSCLLVLLEIQTYDHTVMKWKTRIDTTVVPYTTIKSMRYDRTGRERALEGI